LELGQQKAEKEPPLGILQLIMLPGNGSGKKLIYYIFKSFCTVSPFFNIRTVGVVASFHFSCHCKQPKLCVVARQPAEQQSLLWHSAKS